MKKKETWDWDGRFPIFIDDYLVSNREQFWANMDNYMSDIDFNKLEVYKLEKVKFSKRLQTEIKKRLKGGYHD